MATRTKFPAPWLLRLAASALLVAGGSVANAHQVEQTIPEPGFRPESYCDPEFAATLDTATFAVLPTIIRRAERSAHSFDSQQQIVTSLNEMGFSAMAKPRRVDPGPIRRPSQWEMFEYGARTVSGALASYDTGTDYTLVMEILVPNYQAVFGIEVYLMANDGHHVLSFLLNEHHQMFAEAKLVARNSSEDARKEMVAKATKVGLTALGQQLQRLREDDAAG